MFRPSWPLSCQGVGPSSLPAQPYGVVTLGIGYGRAQCVQGGITLDSEGMPLASERGDAGLKGTMPPLPVILGSLPRLSSQPPCLFRTVFVSPGPCGPPNDCILLPSWEPSRARIEHWLSQQLVPRAAGQGQTEERCLSVRCSQKGMALFMFCCSIPRRSAPLS